MIAIDQEVNVTSVGPDLLQPVAQDHGGGYLLCDLDRRLARLLGQREAGNGEVGQFDGRDLDLVLR